MNQYAYIFTLCGWLQLLSVSMPRKLLCQSFYHIYSVRPDDPAIQTSQIYLGKEEQIMRADKNKTSKWKGVTSDSEAIVIVIFIYYNTAAYLY